MPSLPYRQRLPMSARSFFRHEPRRSALSVSLAACLGLSLSVGAGAAQNRRQDSQAHAPATTHTVTTCADDDSPGSLRAIIASPNTADGDTIDLTQLPTTYGCSTITLDGTTHASAFISIDQPTLHVLGQGVAISAAGTYSSVFRHVGGTLLDIDGLTVTGGKYASAMTPFGGCIYSNGAITLTNSTIDHCSAVGTDVVGAKGG